MRCDVQKSEDVDFFLYFDYVVLRGHKVFRTTYFLILQGEIHFNMEVAFSFTKDEIHLPLYIVSQIKYQIFTGVPLFARDAY
jgi:hypothetical protein